MRERRTRLDLPREYGHPDHGEEVVDDEEDGPVGGQAGEDVQEGVDHDLEAGDAVEDLEDPEICRKCKWEGIQRQETLSNNLRKEVACNM